jgi:hypothetical protein
MKMEDWLVFGYPSPYSSAVQVSKWLELARADFPHPCWCSSMEGSVGGAEYCYRWWPIVDIYKCIFVSGLGSAHCLLSFAYYVVLLSTIDEESDAGKQLLSEWTKAKCYLSTLTVFTAKVARPTCPSPTPKHIPSTKFGKESTFYWNFKNFKF